MGDYFLPTDKKKQSKQIKEYVVDDKRPDKPLLVPDDHKTTDRKKTNTSQSS